MRNDIVRLLAGLVIGLVVVPAMAQPTMKYPTQPVA